MKYGYRTDGIDGAIDLDNQSSAAHQIAFNAVAQKLVSDGWLKPDYATRVRYEGRARIDGKRYPAISQGRLIVVAGPVPPANVEVTF